MLSKVNAALSGFVRANNGLEFIKDRNCIVRREDQSSRTKVKLISGGRSGHEPAFQGYVGKGMLDGAVIGDMSHSPSVSSIVDCIRTVARPDESVLCIVNNYANDRANFGLAVEQARSQYGYKNMRIVLNDDDCSIVDLKVKNQLWKRGLAGYVLLIKILGAMAELGYSLEDLIQFGDGLLQEGGLATYGFEFDVIDGELCNVEMGKGLYGEPGVYKLTKSDGFEWIAFSALEKIGGKMAPKVHTDVAVLVNNLGGTSEFRMDGFLSALLILLKTDYNVKRIYVGRFFTSLNQMGMSITFLNLHYSDILLELLDYEVQVASPLFGGPRSYNLTPSVILKFEDLPSYNAPIPSPEYKLRFNESSQSRIKKILKQIADALIYHRNLLNAYDAECGDGDTGTNIVSLAEALLDGLDSGLELIHPAKMFQDISMIMQRSNGGTLGAVYSAFFKGAAKAFAEANKDQKISIRHWLWALNYGNKAIVQYVLTELDDRTMLDTLKHGETALRESIVDYLPMLTCIENFVNACRWNAEASREVLPKSGRALYGAAAASKTHFEHPDPGAYAVHIWTWALYDGYKELFAESA